ncbi:CAP domain-containing protein [Symbioplanes lichenis]|uniref:CAP domain-containing protein n=1 Tax=Symbioplanes lichenis TaxID=1629072 RepID=UPI002738A2C3|nr:CAP domain-containing protein [Actinoplanes lichenis]
MPPTRHRRPSRKRTKVIVIATAALGVLGAGAAGVANAGTFHHRPQAVRHVTPSLGPATAFADRGRHKPRPRPTASASASTTRPPTSAPTTAPTTVAPTSPPTSASAPPSPSPSASPTSPTPPTTRPTTTPPTTTPPATGGTVIEQALAHINAARTAAGVGVLTLDANLSQASAAHNALMVGGCGLSHQCTGEAGLGDRFTAAGVKWTSAGENIGQGNAANTDASILAAANGLTDLMLAEVAPNDGHRKNLLNAGFKRVGLAVTRGADGRVWFTQDFVN